jgi:predicted RNase H-like nuclease (RuvC/YqgF family)
MNSGNHNALPLANAGSLEGFIKYMGILASSPESQFASAVLGEITQQREQIQSQDEELKELHQEIHHLKETKQSTINDMFTANEKERARQKDSATQIESLRATVHEKEIKIAELSRNLESLQSLLAGGREALTVC